ncbi:hypothetical protein B0H19DRAFT_1064758 [Mycena capillaripes]|nr:hypothetical protein B0H19DRAFT_1064758 [Mycena capillaripes]
MNASLFPTPIISHFNPTNSLNLQLKNHYFIFLPRLLAKYETESLTSYPSWRRFSASSMLLRVAILSRRRRPSSLAILSDHHRSLSSLTILARPRRPPSLSSTCTCQDFKLLRDLSGKLLKTPQDASRPQDPQGRKTVKTQDRRSPSSLAVVALPLCRSRRRKLKTSASSSRPQWDTAQDASRPQDQDLSGRLLKTPQGLKSKTSVGHYSSAGSRLPVFKTPQDQDLSGILLKRRFKTAGKDASTSRLGH